MSFTVFWSEDAESRLANEWLIAQNRRRVTAAADRVDALLQHNAQEVGESRSENRRIVHEPPLGVVFRRS
jgi:plasmid stabilization system protein ParE